MQNNDLVTVICSCFNHAKFVTDSIQSVLNQSYKNIQIIIVDDCSTDDSVSVIENFIIQFPQILFIKNTSNLGLTKSFNNAVKLAKGDYLVDLAADDVLFPDCITIQLETFKNTTLKNLAIVYGNAEIISEKGDHFSYNFEVDSNLKTSKKRISGDLYAKIISLETTICSVSAMLKKSVFDELKGYDERLSFEDLDYWIRVSRFYTIEFIDAILVQKRKTPNSLHSSFSIPKNTNGFSTYLILRKAFTLNKNKTEHRILSKRVNNEIKFALKTHNHSLALRNIVLRIQIGLKSI
ncbi:glycosyltransferase family 2 protein [Flavobacterium cellulosilyticum]|uniref:Glycosyltransferase n=1 Tax=Flavobacterium cellulosilyticum TaxID=2541731 RepID=A0A4R5CG14_9FLAO|nr:glycosyltransferase family 2 protein [Flavobacterium cellulosilyticum]TDD96194.1 glycosyltransferase [Flavobacterium cellulosilyticum]